MYVIAGLGNPGKKYEKTRHNMGFLVLDEFAAKHGIRVSKIRHKALTGEGIINGEKVLLVKPQTYMNLSGESLREVMAYYDVPIENLIVIYDDHGTLSAVYAYKAVLLKNGISLVYGMHVYTYLISKLAHRRKGIAFTEHRGSNAHDDLVSKLHINRFITVKINLQNHVSASSPYPFQFVI